MKRVKELQRILACSYAARVLAVRRVITAKGIISPGVDGYLINSVDEFWRIVEELRIVSSRPAEYRASPILSVLKPKGYGSNEMRPFFFFDQKKEKVVLTVKDRSVLALYAITLLPIAEVTADEGSYGFRQGLGTLDAVRAARLASLAVPRPMMVFDADISEFFDTVSHDWLMENIPMDHCVLNQYLQTGTIVNDNFVPSTRGFPQDSVISPMLANMTLDGLRGAIYESIARFSKLHPTLRFVRYADEVVIMGPKFDWVFKDYIIPAFKKFLGERGLLLNTVKSKLFSREEGFDFLGYRMQWVVNRDRPGHNWLRLTPSNEAVASFKSCVKEVFNCSDASRRQIVIDQLNHLVSGWGEYHRFGHASIAFMSMDKFIWEHYLAWIIKLHPHTNIRDLQGKVFAREGNIKLSPYYLDDKGVKVFLKRLNAIKILSGEVIVPRRPLGIFDEDSFD
jgi:RNA-directed DNA polymerase